jgi:hypothetical protein
MIGLITVIDAVYNLRYALKIETNTGNYKISTQKDIIRNTDHGQVQLSNK